jgi:hypothetical protein
MGFEEVREPRGDDRLRPMVEGISMPILLGIFVLSLIILGPRWLGPRG